MTDSVKNRKTFLSITFLLIVNCISAFAAENLTSSEMAHIDKIMAFRVTLASMEPARAIEQADRYRLNYEKNDKNRFSEEVQFISENIFIVDRINYVLLLDPKDTSMKEQMIERLSIIDNYLDSHEGEVINEWALTSSADVMAMTLSFLSPGEMIKRALMIKKLYTDSIAKNPSYSEAYANLGQWYAEAPAIAGGSKEKARDCFEKAYASAKTDTEKFYAAAMLSQSYFIDKNTAEAEKLLDAADSIQKGTFLIRMMRNANSVGADYFYYVGHKPEIDKKIAKNANKN